MPPRTYRDLTPEELAELERELAPRAPVPRLPLGAQASASEDELLDELAAEAAPARGPSMEIGDIQMLGPGSDEAWLDELMEQPPQTPRTPMLSTTGPGGRFEGEDTPQARALIQQRGLGQAPVADAELLDPSASQRTAAMPQLDQGDELDELIRSEGAAMEREQAPGGMPGQQAARPRSREDEILDTLEAPTRMQGLAALLGDALYGGNMVEGVQQRGRAYQTAVAQARMQDVAAGEKAQQAAADRGMADERLRLTLRGQNLTDARAEQSRKQQLDLAERSDKRIREESALSRAAAMERARVMAAAREGPVLTPQDENAQLSGYLQQQANVSKAEADAFAAGQTAGITPTKLERMEATASQFKTLPPAKRNDVITQGLGRAAMQQDKEEPLRLEARNTLLAQHQAIKEASEAWNALDNKAKQVVARVGGGDSWLGNTARYAMLSDEDQARAAKIQALADSLIKAQSGASVTANEWRRVATEIGLPQDAVSIFNSPASIEAWLQKSRDGFRQVRDSTLQTYKGLFDGMEQP